METLAITTLVSDLRTGSLLAIAGFPRHSVSLADGEDKSNEAVAREILDYFLRNPEAADSLIGIARWRLLEVSVQRSVAKTEGALQWLLEQGYLCQVQMKGAEVIFRLNPEKLRDGQLFLEQECRKEQ